MNNNYFFYNGKRRRYHHRSGFSPLIGIAFLILTIFILFKITKGIFLMLQFATPFLLIAALIINRRVFNDYFSLIKDFFDKNIIVGVIAVIASVAFLPFVSAYLFYRALTTKDNAIKDKRKKNDYIPYTEVKEVDGRDINTVDDDDFLDLPPLESMKYQENSNDL